MHKRIAFLIFTIVIVSSVCATETRIATLGNMEYLYDDNNIFFNPSLINKYQNSLFIELGNYDYGSPSNQYAGLLLGAWGINLGVVLKRQHELEQIVFSPSFINGAAPKNPIQLFFSLGTGNIGLGASLYYAETRNNDGSKQEIDSISYSRQIGDTVYSHNLGLQLGTNLKVGRINLDAWAGIYHHAWDRISDDYIASPLHNQKILAEDYLSGAISIPLGARISLSLGETTRLITGADYLITTLSVNSKDSAYNNYNGTTFSDTAYSSLDKYTIQAASAFGIIETGYGKEKGKVYAGLQLGIFNSSLNKVPPVGTERDSRYSESSQTYYFFPILQFGMEHNLFRWWQFRAGVQYSRTIGTENVNYTGYEFNSYGDYASSDGSFISLGSRFEFGKLAIDAYISESTLFEGLSVITGRESVDPLFGKISINYCFKIDKPNVVE